MTSSVTTVRDPEVGWEDDVFTPSTSPDASAGRAVVPGWASEMLESLGQVCDADVRRLHLMALSVMSAAFEADNPEQEVKILVQAGRVREARELVQRFLDRGPAHAIAAWKKVLSPPTARSQGKSSGRGDTTQNKQWLDENRHRYRDQWVALRDGTFLDADRSRLTLHRRLKEAGESADALFVKIDP